MCLNSSGNHIQVEIQAENSREKFVINYRTGFPPELEPMCI